MQDTLQSFLIQLGTHFSKQGNLEALETLIDDAKAFDIAEDGTIEELIRLIQVCYIGEK